MSHKNLKIKTKTKVVICFSPPPYPETCNSLYIVCLRTCMSINTVAKNKNLEKILAHKIISANSVSFPTHQFLHFHESPCSRAEISPSIVYCHSLLTIFYVQFASLQSMVYAVTRVIPLRCKLNSINP